MPQPNVRVRRTRMLLRQALVGLIEERGFDRVTVGDLASRAMISRAAFYRNYRDKYDLVEQIFDEAITEMTADSEDDTRSPGQRFADFLRHIDAYHRLYGALLGRKGSPWFPDADAAGVVGLERFRVARGAERGLFLGPLHGPVLRGRTVGVGSAGPATPSPARNLSASWYGRRASRHSASVKWASPTLVRLIATWPHPRQ